MSHFNGVWVPIVTPFQHGEVDLLALRRLSEHLLSSGVAGLVVCGTTGEAAALNTDEQIQVLDTVLEVAPGHQVVMGLAGNNLHDVLWLQREVQKRELAGLLVPAPYYIRPSQDALETYFKTIANAANTNIILYDIPYRTGVRLELETLRRIFSHPRIVAIKDCGGDSIITQTLIADRQVDVLVGEDHQILSALCLGASGIISASAHLRPDLFVRVVQDVKNSRLSEARATFQALFPLIRALFVEPNPAPVKSGLAISGIISADLRLPMLPASSHLADQLKVLLDEIKELRAF
ncbi:4-hydroxy-tetrahydrodipicolinate synthase [Pseudomonas monteilii]|uniref:4-hydroxy-tetrahydrodipicolinate synthase n=1 Tax=Pseudomonas monteilii TaxID=76759 RepID=UPI003CFC64D1